MTSVLYSTQLTPISMMLNTGSLYDGRTIGSCIAARQMGSHLGPDPYPR